MVDIYPRQSAQYQFFVKERTSKILLLNQVKQFKIRDVNPLVFVYL
jgi:hypothetical protein